MGLLDEANSKTDKSFEELANHNGTNGTGVLLLNGFGSAPNEIEFFLRYLAAKGFSISCPLIKGYSKFDNKEEINNFNPDNWLEEAKNALTELSVRAEKVVIIGVSFGGNIAITLASRNNKKVAGLIILETPVFFTTKIALALTFLRPILEFFKINFVKKSKYLYRSKYKNDGHSVPLIPVKAVGRIFKYIREHTRLEIRKVEAPIMIVQARQSDLIKKGCADFICDNVKSSLKEILFLPVDNHDLNLLDEEGRVLMIEKIEEFMEKI